ncbi:MAG: hypothetical protein NTX53_21995 [candidate division WOR-3 bacterium]|nr:hypothetical protein [candidate division WOR-3 bacterium]
MLNTADHCDPPLTVTFEEAGTVLVVHVPEGSDKPYRCAKGFYLRVGPSSQKLNRDQIVEFLKAEGKVRFDEMENPGFDFQARFDQQKLGKFLARAGITEVLDTSTMLRNLGAANDRPDSAAINNTGILFFARNLEHTYRHTVVTCALYKGTEKSDVLDRKDFNEDALSSIEGAMVFLRQHLPVRYEFTGALKRREIPELPLEALREAVVNAVCHRDYFERGANVMVEIFDDRVEISNPGGLPKGLSPEEFGKRSVTRNRNIANLLHRLDYIEKMGTGIARMRNWMAGAGLKPPKFTFTTFFTAAFMRPQTPARTGGVSGGVSGAVFGRVTSVRQARLLRLLRLLHESGGLSAPGLAHRADVARRTLERDLALLSKLELIRFTGPPKTGTYVLTEKGRAFLKKSGGMSHQP